MIFVNFDTVKGYPNYQIRNSARKFDAYFNKYLQKLSFNQENHIYKTTLDACSGIYKISTFKIYNVDF